MTLIGAYATQDVTITPRGTVQADGRHLYDGTPVLVNARLSQKTGLSRDIAGNEYTYLYLMWIASDVSIALEDRVTFGGVTYQVRAIDSPRFLDGIISHKRVRLA